MFTFLAYEVSFMRLYLPPFYPQCLALYQTLGDLAAGRDEDIRKRLS